MSDCDNSDSGRGSPALSYRPKIMYHQPKLVDNDLNTQLHYLAAKNDVSGVINYLNQESSIVDPANYLGWTPLMMAVRHGHYETVKCLLQYRANCTLKNKYGMSVFQIAIASGNLEMIKYLLEHFLTGGISKRIMERQLSVISLAVLFRNQEILEFLIEKNFNINWATLDTGVTPLMFAHAIENTEAVATLLKHKVDVKVKNFLGHTAQDITTIRQHLKVLYSATKKLTALPPQLINEEIQNQHLRNILQVKAPQNSPQILSPMPVILVSPQIKYLTLPQNLVHARKSSNASPMPVTPNITPIMNLSPFVHSQPQFFFPTDFSPHHSPMAMTSQAYNSLVAQSYNAEELLNARITNSTAGMFLSPPVTNFLY